MNRSADDLRRWAHEHLVYEAAMLVHVASKVAQDGISDTDRNAFVESFAVHVRCLRDFLWRDSRQKREDALASDFCGAGRWEAARPAIPTALRELDDRNRIGREIVHLTYHRLEIEVESKDWPIGALLHEIAIALALFSRTADSDRLTAKTREALAQMPTMIRPARRPSAGSANSLASAVGATQAAPPQVAGGTIPFPGFTSEQREPPDSS